MNNEKTAAEIMESLMKNGTYPEMKKLEHNKKAIHKAMQKQLADSEMKRHVFTKQGMVAKFVTKRISEMNYEALNEYLSDLGLLLPIVKIDHKRIKKNIFLYDQVKAYQYKSGCFVKPSFNKMGNSLNRAEKEELDDISIAQLASTFRNVQPELENYQEVYEKAKIQMMKCPLLQEKKKLTHEFGSVSLVDQDPLYDIAAIHEEMGEETLIEYGKPDEEKLQRFILKGTITKNEIDQFKTLKDVRLDFVLMSLEAEEKMMQMLNQRNATASHNRMRA